MAMKKTYLGDGVYIATTVHGIDLTTENGVRVTNTICLEPEVIQLLIDFLAAYEFRED